MAMKRISIFSAFTTGLDPAFGTVQSVDIEDRPLGQGGFGEVYRAVRIDGRSSPAQVIKLLIDNGFGMAQRGLETIQELQRRLNKKNAELLQSSRKALLDHIPALVGVPQFSFEGTLEGRRVVGYSANDLTTAGMEDFGRILEDDAKIRQFQSLPLASRMRIASQLVSAFQFLSADVRFIHADIKAEALFVNTKQLRCAVIDFDSGALARDPNDKPTTFGTRQDWLAPEIVKQLDAPGNTTRAVKVDLFSDIWSVNVAIHYLLFGFHPFFFLTEISERSVAAYFQRFQWPQADPSFQYFRCEYAAFYREYQVFLRTKLPADVLGRFSLTFNKGYLDPTARTTYGQWTTVLRTVNRPKIRMFSADRSFVDDGRPVRLSWEVSGARRLDLLGVGEVTGLTSIDVHVRRDSVFTLVLTPDEGPPLRETLQVQVCKEPPRIQLFTVSKDFLAGREPVRLMWKVRGAERIEVDNGIGEVTGKSHLDVLPQHDCVFTLVATSPFGVVAKASVTVRVSKVPPSILYFRSDRGFLDDSTPLELAWKVSDDAHQVVIEGLGPVSREGRKRVAQRADTVYILRATSYFGYSSERRLEVRVSKEPPRIEEFTANPLFVREGMETEIRWKVKGAERVVIEPKIGAVAGEGSLKVRIGREAQFELFAQSYFGVLATARLVVRVLKSTTLATNRATELAGQCSVGSWRPTVLDARRTPLTAIGSASAQSSPGFRRGPNG
jgi:hypothetical protein